MKRYLFTALIVLGISASAHDHINASVQDHISDLECPEHYFTLMDTYERKYCQGQKCRTMGKFKCPNGEYYWVYLD